MIFSGNECDIIELSLVDPSSLDFNYVRGLQDNFILYPYDQKNIGGGITLRFNDVDCWGGAVWIELSKNGKILYSHILEEGECFTYEDDDGMLRCCAVYRVFSGGCDLVEFSPKIELSDCDTASRLDRSDSRMVRLRSEEELSGGAKIFCKQIDIYDEKVLIEIRTDDGRFEKVICKNSSFTYNKGNKNYVYHLDAIFLGRGGEMIEISPMVDSSSVADIPEIADTPASGAVFAVACLFIALCLFIAFMVQKRRL